MLIQKCNKCSTQFTWQQIIKSTFFSFGSQHMECNKCRTKHYANFTTTLIITIVISLPILLKRFTNITTTFGVLEEFFIAIYLVLLALLIALTPFFARYHLENKSKHK